MLLSHNQNPKPPGGNITRSYDLVRSIIEHQRQYDIDGWIQPLHVQHHLQSIAEHLLQGSQEKYPEVFQYQPRPIRPYLNGLAQLRSILDRVEGSDTLIMAVHAFLENLELRGWAVAAGDEEYSAITADLDGRPSSALLANAKEVVSNTTNTPPTPDGEIGSTAAAALITKALQNYGLDKHQWRAEVSDTVTARMSVGGHHRRVRVRSSAVFTPQELARLLVHEVGGHVLRWANSSLQGEPFATLPLGRSVPTEEGLALLHEATFGLSDPATYRMYAARVIAVHTAQTEGILGVGRSILSIVGATKAAEIATRAKRGLRDPNNPGGSTKDWGYLGGMQMLEHLGRQRPDSCQLLQSVKWSADQLDIAVELADLGRLKKPTLIPNLDRLGVPDRYGNGHRRISNVDLR